ncbi:hypothetical protein H0W26_03660, partial [Candidatus Dependentiae bacterium]|nr:hypothetical protein [Candidatus Dependentiae bacterium]
MIKKTVSIPLFLLFILATPLTQGVLPTHPSKDPLGEKDSSETTRKESAPEQKTSEDASERKKIHAITLAGNKLVTQEALLARIPYHVGDTFNRAKTGDLIRNLYELNYFNNVIVEMEEFSDTEIILHITVEEKKKIESILYEGNANLTTDEIDKKLKISEIPTFDEEELSFFAGQIKTLYAEKNYHNVTITSELAPTDNDSYIAVFRINEGEKALVKRICFEGNTK